MPSDQFRPCLGYWYTHEFWYATLVSYVMFAAPLSAKHRQPRDETGDVVAQNKARVCSNCQAVSSNHQTGATSRQIEKVCKMCIPVQTFEKTFGPITFEQNIGLQPNCYHGLPPSTACLLQNHDSQNLILSAQWPHMCA